MAPAGPVLLFSPQSQEQSRVRGLPGVVSMNRGPSSLGFPWRCLANPSLSPHSPPLHLILGSVQPLWVYQDHRLMT